MPQPLVSTQWLEDNLDNPDVLVIEVDEDVEAYKRDHIPGAIAWNWSTDLHHPVQRDYLDQEGFSRLLAEAGATDDTHIVLYGGNNNWFAAYAYWLLRYRGLENVSLVDGGRLKWKIENRPLTSDVPTPSATQFSFKGEERPDLRALRDDVLAAVGASQFVDVRSPEEFSGEKLAPDHLPQEQPYVGGHVPGAVNVPWAKAVAEDGSFLPSDELRKLYEDAGLDFSGDVIAYCRIGERSSHTWFVLHEILGLDHARNYDGSWTEYGSLVGAPVER